MSKLDREILEHLRIKKSEIATVFNITRQAVSRAINHGSFFTVKRLRYFYSILDERGDFETADLLLEYLEKNACDIKIEDITQQIYPVNLIKAVPERLKFSEMVVLCELPREMCDEDYFQMMKNYHYSREDVRICYMIYDEKNTKMLVDYLKRVFAERQYKALVEIFYLTAYYFMPEIIMLKISVSDNFKAFCSTQSKANDFWLAELPFRESVRLNHQVAGQLEHFEPLFRSK